MALLSSEFALQSRMDTETQKRRPHVFYMLCLALLTLWMSLPGLVSIPVIDRDEARYAQATVQMVDSADYLNIKFQDRARNKKPAGIYWMQAASVKAFTAPGERHIWSHRAPSVLAALMAVLATYWGGVSLLGRRGAFIGAAILSVSALFVFEAHIAKTDAMLCAMSAIVLACLLRLRQRPSHIYAIWLWAAVGVGIMIKGPIVPAILFLTLGTILIWERDPGWMKSLISWPGFFLMGFIVVPWAVLIGLETDGAFYREAIGGDLAPKLAGGQESHGAPPGYYLLTLPILFWPGCLLLLSGLIFGVKAARSKNAETQAMSASARLLLCWIIPFWIILEIVPTKLPNYLLPIYPALALICASAAMAMLQVKSFSVSRKIGAIVFGLVSLILLTAIMGAMAAYGPDGVMVYILIIPVSILIFLAAIFAWSGKTKQMFMAGLLTTAILTPVTYKIILPQLDTLFVARRIETALKTASISLPREGGAAVYSPQFTEPSLVYRLGTNILLGDKTETALSAPLSEGDIILLDMLNAEDRTKMRALKSAQCFDDIETVTGVNYSKGDPVKIHILRRVTCPLDGMQSENRPTDPADPP